MKPSGLSSAALQPNPTTYGYFVTGLKVSLRQNPFDGLYTADHGIGWLGLYFPAPDDFYGTIF